MKNIIIVFILLCTVTFQAQNKDEYILEGQQISNLYDGAGCGYLKLATIVEFKIINFSDTNYKNTEIGIIIPCTEFYGENFFKKGKTYILKIKIEKEKNTSKEFDYVVQNIQTLEKYNDNNKYWAISATVSK